MNSNTFVPSARVPARRLAAATAAAALIAGPLALAAPAHATGAEGEAAAVVLRTGLDVALLDKTVHVPLKATLNEVRAPRSADRTALSVTLDGVDKGRPVQLLRADVATAKASVEGGRAEASSNLAKARVHVPGLPLLSLVEIEQVTSEVVCEAGKQPVAESNLLGHVRVLGKKVTLSAGGPTVVEVPAVGTVSLELSRTRTTSTTAAAAALQLKVSVDPLNLNVAEVTGELTLAEATCTSPAKAAAPDKPAEPGEPDEAAPPAEDTEQPGRDIAAQSAEEPAANLAETGGSSATGYIAGGAGLFLAAGAAAIVVTRRRSRAEG
ncbi:SCO1860 family LAETG-anchored protein [Streptomyces genisteinicus]|uniref:LPXTG cell wall anchor domain-containing protein n=1 Tax=Streptomyces genisteinicus TaxID=2768068 RepID=A0A7H0HQ65_9ACTN|nr:SCO1860 family LAETG-anchored protein [Streptomyces genisteinicus]QNP62681.1 LPXTG cell wall anchor domain-containing protein [Streptomyces genisteinicus]